MFGIDFYPTPEELLEKITEGMNWRYVNSVLEPSAGKGDIADFVKEKMKRNRYETPDIDCIEIDKELQHILKGKDYPVIHNDFLTFSTFKKYDLIIMNPPFSKGAAHLTKALELQKNGGAIVCILNAETIRNPYTNERKTLVSTLSRYDADISYMEHEFEDAERKTNVEIAVVMVKIPEKENVSIFYQEMKKKHYEEAKSVNRNDLILNDYVLAAVNQYNIELEAGIRLIQEYESMKPYILCSLDELSPYNKPIMELKLGEHHDVTVNEYVERVRMKYWNALFQNPKFTKHMTSNLVQKYREKVEELKHYDFSVYNIKELQLEMSKNLIAGIEECIINLFNELSYEHSYSDEFSHNIHYYNGWKTNKSWIINKKVIIPLHAFSEWNGAFEPNFRTRTKLGDIEKALNYLDGGLTENIDLHDRLTLAERAGQTRKIQLKYFTVTFYKKGTCHIEFTNPELLKKLNIFGSQKKGWLPPAYEKMQYEDMDSESQAVISAFEGKESYQKIMNNTKYYLFDANDIPLLEA